MPNDKQDTLHNHINKYYNKKIHLLLQKQKSQQFPKIFFKRIIPIFKMLYFLIYFSKDNDVIYAFAS